LLLIENVQRLSPRGLLAAVDRPQVQHPALHHSPGLPPPAVLDAVIAVLLAILDPLVAAQERARLQNARVARE